MWRKKLETSPNVSFLKWVSWAVPTNVKETIHFEKGFPLWWKLKEFMKFFSSSLETSPNRAWRIENFCVHFFVYANTGLGTRCACNQFRSRELPVRTCVYADRVRHRVRGYELHVDIFLVLYYLTLYYFRICYSF